MKSRSRKEAQRKIRNKKKLYKGESNENLKYFLSRNLLNIKGKQ